jgi:dihydroorotate dehydrogenase electron transfer subunit
MTHVTPPEQGQLPSKPTGSPSLSALPDAISPPVVGGEAPVLQHVAVGPLYMRLTLGSSAIASTAQPGQFVMLTVARRGSDVPALPRPMAIYSTDPEGGTITVVYAKVGHGTRLLGEFAVGEQIHVVGPLGRGFAVSSTTRSVLLIGRGIGTCSLTMVAQDNHRRGITTTAVTSARTPELLVGAELYRDHDVAELIEVTDEDGTSHIDVLAARLTRLLDSAPPELILTCGSRRLETLAERLAQRWGASAQVSLEAHMACGLGYCHGCASGAPSSTAETPLVCKDGPVFAIDAT